MGVVYKIMSDSLSEYSYLLYQNTVIVILTIMCGRSNKQCVVILVV